MQNSDARVDTDHVVLCMTSFGVTPDLGEDTVQALQLAFWEASKLTGPVTIEFPKGRYDFYPEHATRRPYYITNTASEQECPDVTKTIGVLLRRMKNIIIEGNDSLFIFHGKQTMIVLDQCENIEIRNVNADFEQPTMAEMTVTSVGAGFMDVRVHPASRYEINHGRLSWIGDGWRFQTGPMQVYDPVVNTTWRIANRIELASLVEEREPGCLRLYGEVPSEIVPDRVLQVRDGIRDQVGAFIVNSRNIVWNNVGMHYMHGLGIVCQFSENLSFEAIHVTPRLETGRTAAAFADILHMSGCRGKITIAKSHFEGAHDDAINVHGTHLKIIDQPAPNQIRVRFMHGQSYGFNAFFPGDEIEFIQASTLNAYAGNKVVSAETVQQREILLTLAQPVLHPIEAGDVIENVTWTPDVEIRSNRFARIPTRGVLISTRGRVRIEDNVFERMQMSAILIADDAESWYESGMVKDVTIRGNRFHECGDNENPVIYIAPENRHVSAELPVHQHIRVEDNDFIVGHATVLAAKSTRYLDFKRNTITSSLETKQSVPPCMQLTACSDVKIEGNTFMEQGMNQQIRLQWMSSEHLTISSEQGFTIST